MDDSSQAVPNALHPLPHHSTNGAASRLAVPVVIGQIVPKSRWLHPTTWRDKGYTTLKAVELLQLWLENPVQETQVGIMLDGHDRIENVYPITMGTYNRAQMIAEDVFTFPRWHGISTIVLAHNHSLGALDPSEFDLAFTRDMERDGRRRYRITVRDHLILGQEPGQYFSFLEHGLLYKTARRRQRDGGSTSLSRATWCTRG